MEESKWEILKKKQAENIAKLAEKNILMIGSFRVK